VEVCTHSWEILSMLMVVAVVVQIVSGAAIVLARWRKSWAPRIPDKFLNEA